MTLLTYKNKPYALADDENVLNCLLRHGIEYPNACLAGICQSCLIKATNGVIEPSWQEGLPATLKAQGYFLACRATPESGLLLESPDTAECDVAAIVTDIERLTHNVIKLKLIADNLENWIPGQYLNLINPDDVSRSYSIANIPAQEGFIELHIKLYSGGAMSQWLQEKAVIDTQIRLRGPFGQCYYYNPDKLSFDIVLAGTGTGLAPLLAILKSAISLGHQGQITLIHGGCTDDDIYYNEELETLAAVNASFHYEPCVLKSNGRYREASIEQLLITHLTNPAQMHVFVCGPKDTTNKLKTKAFLAGVPSKKIVSDAFL